VRQRVTVGPRRDKGLLRSGGDRRRVTVERAGRKGLLERTQAKKADAPGRPPRDLTVDRKPMPLVTSNFTVDTRPMPLVTSNFTVDTRPMPLVTSCG